MSGLVFRRTKAMDDVLAERARQVADEGWTDAHDDEHADGQLAMAGACYALAAGGASTDLIYTFWPWGWSWWKMKNRRRDLVRAGALIIAEIERLDRAALSRSKVETTEGK